MAGIKLAKSVFIKQTIEWVDMIAGYENPNRFQVYYKDIDTDKYYLLFSCKEMSGYFIRNCIVGDIKPMYMAIKHIKSKIKDDNFKKDDKFAVLVKPFQANCLFCDTETANHFKNENGPRFGTIVQKSTFCDPIFEVKNSVGEVIFTIMTNCCKCGYMFRGTCGMFEPVVFLIFRGFNIGSGPVGRINKHLHGIQSLLNEEDTYEVIFPDNANEEEKLNLISAALMIDFIFFEENPNNV